MLHTCRGPLVTVYVVNRNYGAFLSQAIHSVLEQDYPELEILVIDDASTDDSTEVLGRFESDGRVRVIRQPVNRGLTVCSNTAIRQSTGELLMRLDADDYLHPSAVSRMVAAMVTNPAAVLVSPDYVEVDTGGVVIRHVQRHEFGALQAMSDLPVHGACTLVRRSFLESFGLYDEAIGCQDGLDLWLNVDKDDQVLNISEPLFFYRQHKLSLTRNERALLRARGALAEKHVRKRGLGRMRVLAVVPVPGEFTGTDSLPLHYLGDRPLIDWTLDEAASCANVDRVVVSSPEGAVLDHVRQRHGSRIGVYRHEPDGAGSAGLRPTVADVLAVEARSGRSYDAVLILGFESPFRTAMYMQQTVHTLQLFGGDAAVGVRHEDEVFYRHDGLGLRPVRPDDRFRDEREDLFKGCGDMLLVVLDSAGEPVWPDSPKRRIGHVLLDQLAAFRVRTEFDFGIAQHLARQAVEHAQ